MKRPSLLFILVFFCLELGASSPWEPKVSLRDDWRWTGLDFLNDYDINHATKGEGDLVWFVHQVGILSYDGREIRNHPIPRLASQSVRNIRALSDGRILVTTDGELIVWRDGRYQAFTAPDAGTLLRNGIAERADGRVLVATQAGVYELKGDGFHKLEIGHEAVGAILIDARGNLWIGAIGHSVDVYTLTVVAGNLVPDLLHRFGASAVNPFGPRFHLDSLGRVWVLDPDENDQCQVYENYQPKPVLRGLQQHGVIADEIVVIETTTGDFWFCSSRRLARWDGQRLEVYGAEDYPLPTAYPYIVQLSGERILIGGRKLTPQLLDLSLDRWATFPGLNFQAEGRNGEHWFIAEDRRVVRQNAAGWVAFGPKDGLIDHPNRLIITAGDVVWVSGAHQGQAAVALYRNGNWETFRFPDVGMTFSYLAALETKDGEVIFGGGTPAPLMGSASGGAVVFRKTENGYVGHHHPYPAFAKRMANLVERRGDGLLFSTASIYKAQRNEHYVETTKDLFARQWIDHMIVDRKNDLWVACLGVGLYHYAGEAWRVHGEKDGLDTKNILYLLEDARQKALLALTDKGFYRCAQG